MGSDIILVHEHWLLSNNLKSIKNGVATFTGIANSGMDDTQCLLQGRPSRWVRDWEYGIGAK